MKSFDVVVIGSGGGYIAAIRAAQLQAHHRLHRRMERRRRQAALGGTCATSVALLPRRSFSPRNFEHVGHGFAEHGVKVKGLELDLAQMMKRKDKVVKSNNDGIVYLFKKNKIDFFHGRGGFGASPKRSGSRGCPAPRM